MTDDIFDPPATFIVDNIVVGIRNITMEDEDGGASVDYDVADTPDYPLPENWQEILNESLPAFINELLKTAVTSVEDEPDVEG